MKRTQIAIMAALLTVFSGAGDLHNQASQKTLSNTESASDLAKAQFSVAKTGCSRCLASPDQVPEGLSPPEWSSICKQYHQRRHAAVVVDGGYHARNPAHQWLTRFDGSGFTVTPDAAGWQWGLELRSYGFPGHEVSVRGQAVVVVTGQSVSYDWDTNLEEWFINDARGLEHGFTFRERPPGVGDRLLLELAVRGGLRPEVQAKGSGVRFVDECGAVVLTYAGLLVYDADGRCLPARFEPVGDRERTHQQADLRLAIEEGGARYPLIVDPIAQQAYLKASNTGAADLFGLSVAVSGDTVVIGAPYEDSSASGVNGNEIDDTAIQSGAAYVFVRSGTNWSQQAYLKASNPRAFDEFGHSVALSGDTAVIGAHLEDTRAGNSGAAYVFVRSGTNWSQQAYLKASNADAADLFGYSIAISGDSVVVGSYGEDSNATGVNGNQSDNSVADSGAAYVFVRDGTNWSEQAYLKASNVAMFDLFGSSVALSGDTAVIGAYLEDTRATNSGAAYVFVRSGTNWSQQAYLKASNAEADDLFGYSVAISGDTVVVSAREEDSNAIGVNGNQSDNSASRSGAAYVFVRSGTNWSQQAYLKASNTEAGDYFGFSAAVSGEIALVGAYQEDSNAIGVNGNQSDNSASRSGAAYVFVRSGTNWSQQAYLKASNTNPADWLGYSVAGSGDTVVVGALLEDSRASGVNGNQSDNSADGSGAAYLFTGLGLDPCSSLHPRLALVPDGSDGYFIRFSGVPGCTYRLERAPSVTGPWETIATLTAPASGLVELHDTSLPAGQAFYRTVRP